MPRLSTFKTTPQNVSIREAKFGAAAQGCLPDLRGSIATLAGTGHHEASESQSPELDWLGCSGHRAPHTSGLQTVAPARPPAYRHHFGPEPHGRGGPAAAWPSTTGPGVAGPGKPSEDEAARPAADLLQVSGAPIPSANRDATEPPAHSPRRSPGRDAALSSAIATPSSSSPKPTNPRRAPAEELRPRPLPRGPARGAPGGLKEGKREGKIPGRATRAQAQ